MGHHGDAVLAKNEVLVGLRIATLTGKPGTADPQTDERERVEGVSRVSCSTVGI